MTYASDANVHATLLNLINQAKATGSLSPPTGQLEATPPPQPSSLAQQHNSLDPTQLKLFQHLAQVAAGSTPSPGHIGVPLTPLATPAYSSSTRTTHASDPRQRPRDPRLGSARSDGPTDPCGPNGHDQRLGHEERIAERTRDERSRSPVSRSQAQAPQDTLVDKHIGRRDVPPPPPGPRATRSPPTAPRAHAAHGANTQIDAQHDASTAQATAPATQSAVPGVQTAAPAAPAAAAETPSSTSPTAAPPHTSAGLDTFDWTTFDATSSACWEALAAAWVTTNGYAPAQEELMFLLSCGMGIPPPVAGPWGPGWLDVCGGSAGGWGEQRQEAMEAQAQPPQQRKTQQSDAVTLVSGREEGDADASTGAEVGKTGKMEKVGDMWMFVRSTA
ncbi:hypothetical protein K488DRAFT_84469 [Vararia minispora EC-137]|uniref:Uncharacterized protein n=1 Tax=Vararia minispora EC-137 TaxID=1314806 RepID=A0ACB8QQN3_9AGAM|nr:hypothetical protein K488DRAFT_84469 [Vararia minispora EC-137]